MWQNNASARTQSYLRDAAGNIVESGNVNLDGKLYNLSTPNAPTFAGNQVDQTTWSHGLNLRSNTGGKFDWELVGSLIDLSRDTVRAPTVNPLLAAANGTGRTNSLAGSGWYTFDAKGIWRPGVNLLGLGYHEVSFGVHHSQYTLKIRYSPPATGKPAVLQASFQTRLEKPAPKVIGCKMPGISIQTGTLLSVAALKAGTLTTE